MGSYGSSELCVELVGGLIELEQRAPCGDCTSAFGEDGQSLRVRCRVTFCRCWSFSAPTINDDSHGVIDHDVNSLIDG